MKCGSVFARIHDFARHHAAMRLLHAARTAVFGKALDIFTRQTLASNIKTNSAGRHRRIHAFAVTKERQQGPIVHFSHSQTTVS